MHPESRGAGGRPRPAHPVPDPRESPAPASLQPASQHYTVAGPKARLPLPTDNYSPAAAPGHARAPRTLRATGSCQPGASHAGHGGPPARARSRAAPPERAPLTRDRVPEAPPKSQLQSPAKLPTAAASRLALNAARGRGAAAAAQASSRRPRPRAAPHPISARKKRLVTPTSGRSWLGAGRSFRAPPLVERGVAGKFGAHTRFPRH